MRQIRVSTPRTRVTEDVRAGLTALGKGDADVGGVALVGLPVPGTDDVLDAVVIGPTGVTIIAGVDLPGPAMHLDAPLHGQWKADNWPLVGDDDAVNPAAGPLDTAHRLATLIAADTTLAVDVAIVLAVGPYVDRVSNGPTADDGVAVTYPTAPNLRTAIVDLLGTDERPCSVERARAVLHAISGQPPVLRDTELVAEGFRAGGTAAHPGAEPGPSAPSRPSGTAGTPPATPRTVPVRQSTGQSAPSTTPATDGMASAPPSPTSPQDGRPVATSSAPAAATPAGGAAPPTRRRVPRAVPIATALLVMVAVVVLVVTLTGSADSDDTATPSSPPTSREQVSVAGTELIVIATATGDDCTQATVGDVQATVIAAGCTAVRRGSYLTTSQPEAAVSVAEFEVHDPGQAQEIRTAAETPGGGAATDIATVQQQWPDSDPHFTNAAYDAVAEGSTVRLARAAWTERESSPDDEQLRSIAETALTVPLPN